MSRRRPHAQSTGATGSGKRFRGRAVRQARTSEDNVRTLAAWVIERTLNSLAPSSVFLASALERCDEPDHALLRELSLGTLRWLRRLDDVIAQASNRAFDDIEPALRAPLRVATYQLLLLDRIPAHAAVNEAVEHARRLTHRGGASFTNAVLRRIAREPKLDAWPVRSQQPLVRLAIENSHPDFLVERWVDQLGQHATERLLAANNRPKAMQLLAFKDRGGRELLAEDLIDEGIDVEPSTFAPMGLIVRGGNALHSQCYQRGDFYIQDQASQAAALLPAPRAGERVLDAAAAPGGKTFSLLAVEPDLDIVLGDVSPARAATIGRNLTRLGRQLPVVVADAGRAPFAGEFDRVVLDLPCAGTGTLRKHPELKWRISSSEIGRLSRQALRMLEGSARRVKRGGYLIAVTCSLEPEENAQVIARFLSRNESFLPLPLEENLTFPLDGWILGPGSWRILPAGDHDGFTVNVLTRRR